MSVLWPKIDVLNFDPNQLTEAEAIGLSEAYVALASNPAFALVIQQVKETQANLNNVTWITTHGYDPQTALAMIRMLDPIALVAEAVAMVQGE